MNTTVKKVAIYARVSTDRQDERSQIHDLYAAAASRGWVVRYKFIDHAKQGDAKRPELERLLKKAQSTQPGFQAVIVWDLSRLGRSRVDLDRKVAALRKAGIGLVSLREGIIDTTTANGDFQFALIAALAQLEKQLIGERRRSQNRAKRQRGETLGGRPRGFDPEAFLDLRRGRGRGLSQTEAAKELGIVQSRVSHHDRLLQVLEGHYEQPSQ